MEQNSGSDLGENAEESKLSPSTRLRRRILIVMLVIGAVALAVFMSRNMIEKFIERTFVFYPIKQMLYSPHAWGLNPEDVYFQTPDGVNLNAWLIDAGEGSPMVLWFHGNAGNISSRVENARLLFGRGLSLFMVDYRGYGRSGGQPSEKGIYTDGQAAYDYLISRDYAPDNIIIFGRSLGSTVTTYVAANNKCAGVILESAITNMAEAARAGFPFLPGLGIFKKKFDSIGRIGDISAPILFFHGDRDELVPYKLGRRLYDAAGPGKVFYTISGAHHNDTYEVGRKPYFDAFEKFARDNTGKKTPAQSGEQKE